jgi:uncharacterized LabA/DUF88 family protein
MSNDFRPASPMMLDTEYIHQSPSLAAALDETRELIFPESLDMEMMISEELPGLRMGEPTCIILDLNNLYKRARKNNFTIDYEKLYEILAKRCDLRYAAGFIATDMTENKNKRWVDWMQKAGYTMFVKDLKYHTAENGGTTTKGNMDVDITLEAKNLHTAFSHVILATCDGDFKPLVEDLQKGSFRKVSVLGINDETGRGTSRALVRSVIDPENKSARRGSFFNLEKLRRFIEMRKPDAR